MIIGGIIIILWGGVGGFDWALDIYECLNTNTDIVNEINNYLQTIADLETKLEHTSNLYEGSQEQINDYIKEVEVQQEQITILNEKIELQQHSIKLLSIELDEAHKNDSQSD